MIVEIRSRAFTITEPVRQHVERRLKFALDRFADVKRVAVCLGDLNGPRGGADKFCRICVFLNTGVAVVEEVQPDMYSAISRAAHRLAMKVARKMGRVDRPIPFRAAVAYGGAA